MDEQVPRAVTVGLPRRGVDALTAQEAGMLEADDEEHLAFASVEGRIILTPDADFLEPRITVECRWYRGTFFVYW